MPSSSGSGGSHDPVVKTVVLKRSEKTGKPVFVEHICDVCGLHVVSASGKEKHLSW